MAVLKKFEVLSRQPVFDGMCFGENGQVGAYELLSGRAHCEIDPAAPLNKGIVNLSRAPRAANGLVEYSVDFHIYKPVDLERGNGWLFYEYLNRGTQRGIVRINNAPVVALPSTPADIGNGFLMNEGYSIVWTAWQGNVEPGGGRMLAQFPVATDEGKPITGTGWEEFVLDAPDSIRGAIVQEAGDDCTVLTLSYPAANLDPASASLTARQHERDPRVAASGIEWRFLDRNRIEVRRLPHCTLDRGAIFEFIYEAQDPVVMGLGYASVRDVMAFLKYESHDSEGTPNPLWQGDYGRANRALGFGLSQSGRVLRDFIYQGFNESLDSRIVFDAAVPIISGSRRAWVNAAFSQPGRYSRQHEDHNYPGDQFPFAYQTLTDPVSGKTDGILARAEASKTVPRIMQMDTDSEAWSARASLVATDCEGRDLPEHPQVRLYLMTGIAHGDYPLPTLKVTRYATNPLTYGASLRALLVAMREWIDDEITPPPSAFPSHASGTWWTLDNFRERFEADTGIDSPRVINELHLLDHTQVPPKQGARYPVFVPSVDADGNGSAGVRHPFVQAPLGTHAGWAPRAEGFACGGLYSVYGSYIPFARDGERPLDIEDDRRPSFEARYESHDAWRAALLAAASSLVDQRLMLPDDAALLAAELDRASDPFHII
ncbi:alpha/beta hydrolase domain-containing protein [Caballeronia sp. HLA56]